MLWPAWSYPDDRYYYQWMDQPLPEPEPTDAGIKSALVDRLHENPYTADEEIKVDVKQHVVILGGVVSSWLARGRCLGHPPVWSTSATSSTPTRSAPRPGR